MARVWLLRQSVPFRCQFSHVGLPWVPLEAFSNLHWSDCPHCKMFPILARNRRSLAVSESEFSRWVGRFRRTILEGRPVRNNTSGYRR